MNGDTEVFDRNSLWEEENFIHECHDERSSIADGRVVGLKRRRRSVSSSCNTLSPCKKKNTNNDESSHVREERDGQVPKCINEEENSASHTDVTAIPRNTNEIVHERDGVLLDVDEYSICLERVNLITSTESCYPGNISNKRDFIDLSRVDYADQEEVIISFPSSSTDNTSLNRHSVATKDSAKQISFKCSTNNCDDAIVTEGIISLIDQLKLSNVATCSGKETMYSNCDHHANAKRSIASSHLFKELTSSILHFQQNDKWSCGYRNLQMMLSALLPHLPTNHPYFQMMPNCHHDDNRGSRHPLATHIPSLQQLQCFLEQSWVEGFDPKGAKYYNHRISGRTCQIGAVEVCSVLSYLHIDATLVQFLQCHESRSVLGDFVWSYFSKRRGKENCFSCSGSSASPRGELLTSSFLSLSSSTAHASELLGIGVVKMDQENKAETCFCPILPLYLQWEGHSVTIVGIEKRYPQEKKDGESKPEYTLLVFDPMKKGSFLKERLHDALASQRRNQTLDLSMSVMPGGNSVDIWNQSLSCNEVRLDGKCIFSMHLPASRLLEKDCQIVLCTMRQLDSSEKQKCRDRVNAVTAAADVVALRKLQR